MPTHHVLIADGLMDNGQAILRFSANVDDRTGLSSEELLDIIPDYDALIVRSRTRVTAQVFEAAEKLKVVGRAGVGVDNIDLEAAKAHNVTVVNSPTTASVAVAELTFGLMLALVREISLADIGMKRGEWLKKDLAGTELYGKTLGILGMGRIGAEVGMRAAAFGMRVLGYDPLLTGGEIRQRGAEPVTLDDLFDRSEFISLHLPFTDETRLMIDQQAFAQMKSGVRVVCVARGGIIDESALLEAIKSGQVAGAALDVFAVEPPGATELIKHPNVIASPHIGAQTAEAQLRAAEDIANEVLSALKDEPLRWKIV